MAKPSKSELMNWLDENPDNIRKTAKILCQSECEKESKKENKKETISKATKKTKHKSNKSTVHYNQTKQSNRISDYMDLNRKYLEELESRVKDTDQTSYGDRYTKKSNGSIRVWFTNPCGISINPHKLKNHNSMYFLRYKSRCDYFGLAETNVNWHLLKGSASLYSRVKYYWKRFKTVTAHNKHSKHGVGQRGGNCAAAMGQLAHRATSVGKDSKSLGRWVWIEFQGKMGIKSRIYTAYRPGKKPASTSKKTTVFHQQARYMRKHKIPGDPRSMFDGDLKEELESILNECNVILMLDANEDIENGKFNQMILSLGLKNSILSRVNEPMPATHHRGSRPISTIYHSAGLSVVRAGVVPTGIGVHGDHRNIYADFDQKSFFGDPMYMVAEASMKKLQLRDSRIYKRYIKELKKHLQENNWLKKGQLLLTQATYPASIQMKEQMESLDMQLGRGIVHALKKCRNFRMGKIPYSGMFNKLQKEQRLWILVYKRKIGQKISSSLIQRLSKQTRYQNPLTYSIKEVLHLKNEAERKYNELIPHASTERKRFLEELAAANAQEMRTDKLKMIKKIMTEESTREQNVIIRTSFPKSKGPSKKVDCVEYKKDGEWVEVSKPSKLIKALQVENEVKYNCTGDTPLMSPKMQKLFGNFAETKFAREFQNGIEEAPEMLPELTKMMLEKTRYDRKIPRISTFIKAEEIKRTWRITKEKKASAPSGRYNAVYKAMTIDPLLLQILTISMNLPFATGQAYDRWHTFLDIMAFKKADSKKVNTLRSIVLSEADWNAAGRMYVTKKMMKQAETLQLLPNEHLGGRKGRKSIDGAIAKKMYLDNTRIMRIPTIILSTDAANCYDRMIHKYISLMSIKWGLEPQIMSALLQPLQKARHHTRTAYGDSTEFFEGKNLQGAGQGNTGAAPFWTCVSTSMIEIMKDNGFHANLVTPMSKRNLLLALIAFVDDTETFLTEESNDITKLIAKAQDALNIWKNVLNATGGAMRSKKCAWLLLSYMLNNKDTIFESSQKFPKTLDILDDDNVVRPIERYEYSDAREYLGVLQSANNDDSEQYLELQKKVRHWNEMMNNNNKTLLILTV